MPPGFLMDAPSPGAIRHGLNSRSLVPLAAAAAALALVAWRLDWERLAALGSVHAWTLLAAAASLQLLTLPLKAAGWHVTLNAAHPGAGSRFGTLLGPVAVGALFNLALAGRVGDAARVLLVHARLRRTQRPAAIPVVVGSAITETLVSAVAWVILMALAGTLVPLPPIAWVVIASVGFGTALVALAAWRGWGRGPHAVGAGVPARLVTACRRVWATVAEGHRTLRRPRVILPLAGASIAGWVAQWGSVYAVLRAFDVPGPAEAATLVLVSTSVAQTLPVVPGNLGVYQAAVALPLAASSGTPATVAVAIGVVLQAVQTAPIAFAGAAATARQEENVRELWHAARRFELRPARHR